MIRLWTTVLEDRAHDIAMKAADDALTTALMSGWYADYDLADWVSTYNETYDAVLREFQPP